MTTLKTTVLPILGALGLGAMITACDGSSDTDGAGGSASGGRATTGGSSSSSGGRASGGSSSTSGGASSGGAVASGGRASGGADAAGGEGGEPNSCQTIVEIAASNPDFSTLVAAVTKAGLVEALGGEGLTVFAPTNAAFEALLEGIGIDSLDDLSVEQLTPILTYHVLGAEVDSTAAIAVAQGEGEATSLGGTLKLSLDDGELILDADEASATVTATDIEACNGLIHVIDGVVLPSILDVVSTQPAFTGLLGLVGASSDPAGLAGVLDGPATAVDPMLDPGGFTLFAPSNEAIAALPSAPPAATLTTILQYHVYASDNAVLAATALTLDNATIEMVSGDELTVDGGTGVTLTDGQDGESEVITTDILTANGVIHRIDGVLLP